MILKASYSYRKAQSCLRQIFQEFPRFIDWCFYISKMLVIAVAGKICHIAVHISLANCTDPLCPVFQACLVCQNAADFDDDTCLDLKRRFNISF